MVVYKKALQTGYKATIESNFLVPFFAVPEATKSCQICGALKTNEPVFELLMGWVILPGYMGKFDVFIEPYLLI